MGETAIKIENLKKQYRLGAIGGQTLNAELQSWWARKRGKEDPNLKIGQDYSQTNEKFWALKGITLEVKKGEALGIIGGNGAGKSTLLKILSRVTAPTEGDIWIDGRVSSMLEVGTGFHPELTGRENIYMNGAILGMTKKEVDEKIESIIDFSECRQFIDTPVKRYSSGMYVKLAFAVASHLDAEIMIMDEVLAVGDMNFQKKCLGKMNEEAHGGKTILYVSHNMATIRNLCDRCVVLQKGKVLYAGEVEKAIGLYMDADSELADAYMSNDIDYSRDETQLGSAGRINYVHFLDKTKLSFMDSETIKIQIEVEAYKDLENLFMGMVIKSADTTVIGFDYVAVPNLEKGEKRVLNFENSFCELPAGGYYLHFNLHQENEIGIWSSSIDQTADARFSVENSDIRLQWRRDWFGYVDFKQMKYVE